MKLFYKIKYGFDKEQELPIEAEELEKAIGAFITDGKAVFHNGAVKGTYIHAIVPDFHRIMGWNPTHKLDPYDYAELKEKNIDRAARDFQELTETRVRYLITSNQKHLIGTGAQLPELEAKHG